MNNGPNVAVVTGAAKGIGRACAERFFRDGYRVGLLDTDVESGRATASALGEGARFVRCDVRSEEEVKAAVREVIDSFGEIGILVNSAGIQRYSTVTETSEEEWDLVLGVNLKGSFFTAKHAIPSMLRRGAGCVINIASVNALHCQRNTAPYATSKAALLGLTRSIAVDYAPRVRCVAVCPGTVDTPMLHKALAELPDPERIMEEINRIHLTRRTAKPEEIASLVAHLCGPDGGFITGHEIRIDGGLGILLGGT